MEKIVVLNSGGFDSTVLLVDTVTKNPDCEIHSLYFSYGQLNDEIGASIALENANKLGVTHHQLIIPPISWSKGNFYKEDTNEYVTQYLEMRNLIFLSYAISMAESLNADVITMALLKSHGYVDTSPEFIELMKEICKLIGVDFQTPYSGCDKYDIYGIAKTLKVGPKFKFISCDTPDEKGNPCGKCLDCESIAEYNQVLKDDIPVKAFFSSNLDVSNPTFRELYLNEKVTEMRVLINNECQLNCEHCYHKNNPLVGERLTDEEMIEALNKAYEYGIREFHFAGKEPLYDERIFKFTEYLSKYPDVEYHVVTNGINVPKYAERIKSSGISKVFLSIDDCFGENQLRSNSVNECVKKAITSLNEVGVPIELFYDLTPENIGHTTLNIKYFNAQYGVKNFYVRTIRDVISDRGFLSVPLTNECLDELHQSLKEITSLSNCDYTVGFNIGACPYTYNLLMSETGSELAEDIYDIGVYGNQFLNPNYYLLAEAYCAKYESQITLMPDGYILGCAMECSVRDYDKISSGNIKDKPLSELIKVGKLKSGLATNDYQTRDGKIFFNKCVFNPIDFND